MRTTFRNNRRGVAITCHHNMTAGRFKRMARCWAKRHNERPETGNGHCHVDLAPNCVNQVIGFENTDFLYNPVKHTITIYEWRD